MKPYQVSSASVSSIFPLLTSAPAGKRASYMRNTHASGNDHFANHPSKASSHSAHRCSTISLGDAGDNTHAQDRPTDSRYTPTPTDPTGSVPHKSAARSFSPTPSSPRR